MLRTCVKCGTLFDGSKCKVCANIVAEKYRAENSEKVKAATKKWQMNNPKKRAEAVTRYRTKNPEKHAENLKKHAEYIKKWRVEHPEVWRIYLHNREARKAKNGGVLSTGLAAKLFNLQKGKCACCGLPLGSDAHLDHVMPLALGGANEDWNIQLLRPLCNKQKQARHPVAFMQSRGFLL